MYLTIKICICYDAHRQRTDPPTDFFLFQYRMERSDTGIVIRISLSAKWMPYPPAVQELLKWSACILASQVAVENDPSGLSDVQTGVLNSFYRQFRCHGFPYAYPMILRLHKSIAEVL